MNQLENKMKLIIGLLLTVFSSTAFATSRLDVTSQAIERGCLIAIGLTQKGNPNGPFANQFLCINNPVTEAGTYKELRGCAVSIVDTNTKSLMSFQQFNFDLQTSIIQVAKPCSRESVPELITLPISENQVVGDLIKMFIGFNSDPHIVAEVIPFSKILSELHSKPVDVIGGGFPSQPGTTGQSPADMNKHHTVKVFFGTDRKVLNTGAGLQFTGDRNENSQITLGVADVSIPKSHKPGELEAPSVYSLEFRNNPDQHVMVKSVAVEGADTFFQKIKAKVSTAYNKDLFIFVHGYNVTFDEALRRTAQIAFDIQFQGAPILYSWPSEAKIWRYPVDEANVEWSYRHLSTFINDIVKTSGAQKIHLIAHSMGNRALTNAIESLWKSRAVGPKTFQEVILAAPDVDAGTFKDISYAIKDAAKRVTVYSSGNDKALMASKWLHKHKRLGLMNLLIEGIQTIDASLTDTSMFGLGHSYYGSKLPVLEDIKYLLIYGYSPEQRYNLKPIDHSKPRYWTFK